MAATGAAAPILAGATARAEASAAASPQGGPSAQKILALFDALPGDKAVKILAPAAGGKPEFRVEMNTAK
jgi:hypothetical protein